MLHCYFRAVDEFIVFLNQNPDYRAAVSRYQEV